MRFGVCTSTVDDTALLADAGFDFVEGNIQRDLVPEQSDEAFGNSLERIQAMALPMEAANCFFPGDLKLVGESIDVPRLDRYVRTACQRAGEAGIRTLVMGSGGARKAPEGFAIADAQKQLEGHFRRWGPIAQAFSVTIAIEPLQPSGTNTITTLIQGADLVDHIGHKHVQLLADSWHMHGAGEPVEHIEVAGRRLVHVHVAESPERTAPGTCYGEAEFVELFQELKKAGYNGRVSIEAQWESLHSQARVALSTLREALEIA